MKYIKILLTISFVFQLSYGQNITISESDPLSILIPEEAFLNDYCATRTLLPCDLIDSKKYSGMRGKLRSLNPVLSQYGRDLYEIKMANGKTLYFSNNSNKELFSKENYNSILNLKAHLEILNAHEDNLIENSSITYKNFFDRYGKYQYILSTGQVVSKEKLNLIQKFLPNVPKEKELNFINMIDNLTISFDDIEDSFFIFIYENQRANDSLVLLPYIGYKDNKVWMRFLIQYSSDKWLFIKRFLIKADDNKKEFRNLNFKRDHRSPLIWEWHDKPASQDDIELLKEIVASNKTVVRLYGDNYSVDRTITEKQKEYISNILELYAYLSETE